MDNNSISMSIQYAFPSMHWLMRQLPFEGVRELIQGPERIRKYGRETFERYIDKNGRQPKRPDLLTKFLAADVAARQDGESIALSDLNTYTESGNMVFAGAGELTQNLSCLEQFVLFSLLTRGNHRHDKHVAHLLVLRARKTPEVAEQPAR